MSRRGNRDDFPIAAQLILARRAGDHCSNPDCGRGTSGPHSDTHRAVNLGIAAHITAASPKGPRFDPTLSTEIRSSLDNGIWLCHICAAKIDRDKHRYPTTLLHAWKQQAEKVADRRTAVASALIGNKSLHTRIPNVDGLSYHDARVQIIEAGWQPRNTWWPHQQGLQIEYGNGYEFWRRGYREIKAASGTGYAFCRFEFVDVYSNVLIVVTAGEESPESGCEAGVVNVFLDKDNHYDSGPRRVD